MIAQAFLDWTQAILPTLGFLEIRFDVGGVKSIVALSSTTNTLEYTFIPEPISGNPYQGSIIFDNNGGTCNEELLAFWVHTLYRDLFCFRKINWLRMRVNLIEWGAACPF